MAKWQEDDDKIDIRYFGRLDLCLRDHYHQFRAGEFEWLDWIIKRNEDQDLKDDLIFDIDAGVLKNPHKRRFDGSKLPEDFEKSVAGFLGPYGWVLETQEDGWAITGCLLSKGEKSVLDVDAKIEQGKKTARE